ncbi:MAG: FGGY family carbohydrate kinase [Geminicoccales bacterium]
MAERVILAVDQGTTNSKAILVAEDGRVLASGSSPVPIEHPRSGWVQQDGEQIWKSVQEAITVCLANADNVQQDVEIAAIGISNQRESVLAWDRRTGKPTGPVITWQCRRTAEACERLRSEGLEDKILARTGLPLDPLFPATKVRWLLDHLPTDQDPKDLCIGTVDSWLIWNFSGGVVHACDRSNAARTQLFDIAKASWDEGLCEIFGVAPTLLPDVQDSSHIFGKTSGVSGLADGIPIGGAIGDSHGALFGHGAYSKGDGKVTFGTGSSVMATIAGFKAPPKGLTTTIAWSLDGVSTFAFEGNILVSASVLPWTADLLGLADVEALLDLAETVKGTEGVSLVPAFVGLGAPHWNAEARGLVAGLSFGSKPTHLARAAAESMALQVHDVFDIVQHAAGAKVGRLFVDGGPSSNRFLMGLVAGYLNHPVIMCETTEASALGAAYLAGLSTGVWDSLTAVSSLAGERTSLSMTMDPAVRQKALKDWRSALARSKLDA